jgi:hypothetical protein
LKLENKNEFVNFFKNLNEWNAEKELKKSNEKERLRITAKNM